MFYSQFILAKKGPLGTVWIAAHLERKLRKSQVNETDISLSVDSILFPEVPIALRLSGHLMLGVVRIYARKVNYLYQDCSEALVKIKHAFSSGAVDLPPDAARAPFHSITLPETFEFNDALQIPYQEAFHGDMDLYVTDRDQITLHDPLKETFFLTPNVELFEQFQDDGLPIQQDKELLFTIPQREPTPPMQTLEEDVLPPMTIDLELDENLDGRLEVTFPDWMNQDEPSIASAPMAIDQTDVDVSGSKNSEHPIVSRSDQLAALEQADMVEKDMLADDYPEVEKLRSAVGPTLDEPDLFAFLPETLINDQSLRPTDRADRDEGTFLMEEEEVPELNKDQAGEESVMLRDDPTSSFPASAGPPTSNMAAAFSDDDDMLASILGSMPSIQVAATPVEIPTPRHAIRNRRKRKQFFDTATVIPSELMKRQNEHTDDLRRVRRKASPYLFEKWRVEKDYHIKEPFPKASIFGLCSELYEMYTQITAIKETVSSTVADVPTSPAKSVPCTPQLIIDATGLGDHISENVDANETEARNSLQPGTNEMEPMYSPTVTIGLDNEFNQDEMHEVNIERMAHDLNEGPIESTDLAVSLGMAEDTAGQCAEEEVDRQLQVNVAASETTFPTMAEQGEQWTPKAQEADTIQNIHLREEIGAAAVTPVHESCEPGLSLLSDSTLENGEFLDDGGYEDPGNLTPNIVGQEHDGWSGRTRAVAQFLQEAFKAGEVAAKSSQQQQSSVLSLDKMLKKRNKKQAARMFFETLVLRTQDFIGVEQEDAYLDISLTARPKLLKTSF